MSASDMKLFEDGPFPEQIDPWVEDKHYFHQLHGHMITNLFNALRQPVYEAGYMLGREGSIQVLQPQDENFMQNPRDVEVRTRNYEDAVAGLNLEAGMAFIDEEKAELDRLFVKSLSTGRLVTVIEIVSPNNKLQASSIAIYQNRRRALLKMSVDVVEIDLTRSLKHLVSDTVARGFPYHVAIYLHDALPRFFGIGLEDKPKNFALPVEEHFIPVELYSVYRESYEQLLVAFQMYQDKHYTEANLPVPATLKDYECRKLLETLAGWEASLA